jgi:hypothetical protein
VLGIVAGSSRAPASSVEHDVPQDARNLPPIIFVSRKAPTGSSVEQIPGVGPGGRTLALGGELLIRDRDGRVRSLLPASALYDVSDPAVSWDAQRVVFAGLARPGEAWRLYVVGVDGSGLRQLTKTDRVLDLSALGEKASRRFDRYDDFDPCWMPDGRIVFASTRFPQISQAGGFAVSNLFVVRSDGGGLERITSERNGAEEPTIDPRTGRIVYSRWFFSPYLASDSIAGGLTQDRGSSVLSDTVNFWQAVSIFPDGDRIELAAANLRTRGRVGAYQPLVLANGTIVGVSASNPSMFPAPGDPTLISFGRVLGELPRRIQAAAISPAALSGDRIVFARASLQRLVVSEHRTFLKRMESFGLYAASLDHPDRLERVLDLRDTDELDPVPLVKRKVPPVIPAQGGVDDPAWTLPVTRLDQVRRGDDTFRFDCLNVFLTGPVDSPFPDAPRLTYGASIRFFAALARPEAATGDTVVLVREAKLDASGAVHESDIPGDVPMFEQLVDAHGRVLRSAHGPAHVPGMNFSRIGSGTKCVGCHEGHSALPVPKNNFEAKWFNASPSATVTVSSTFAGGGGALVDRRAKGPIRDTGWVAEGAEGQWARLAWGAAIEARTIVLYAPSPDGGSGTRLQLRDCQVVLLREGREVGRAMAGRVRPEGTRVDFSPVRIDAIEVRPTRVSGTVERRLAVALAEIETIARLIE